MMRQHGACTFSIHLETDPVVIRAVRKVVAAMARLDGASDVDARLIEFSVGEALGNARLYAYQNGVGPIEVVVTLGDAMFSVVIQNEGKGVTSSHPIPDMLGAQEAQGWGLYLIGRMMDEVEITRSTIGDHGTAIRMSKRLVT